MPHDFTYMWNLKKKINKQTIKTEADSDKEEKLMVARWEES